MSETTHGGWIPEEEPEPTVFQQLTDIVAAALTAQAEGEEGVLEPASVEVRRHLEALDFSTLRQALVEGSGASAGALFGVDPTSTDSRALIVANDFMQDYLRITYPELMEAGGELHKLVSDAFLQQATLHDNARYGEPNNEF